MTTTSRELRQLATFGLAGLLVGCGGSPSQGVERSQGSQPAPRDVAAAQEHADPDDLSWGAIDEVEADGAWSAGEARPVTSLGLAAAPAKPELRAEVELVSLRDGAAIGHVVFRQQGDEVVIAGDFADLPPGLRGMRMHENADCGGKGASRAGKPFNPTGAKYGPPEAAQRHAGNFGNISVGDDRRARFDMTTDSITVAEGRDSVVGRSLVITARRDNGKSATSAGPAIACGVIALPTESTASR
jgi:superoxide dismutase, Cu-Zn family